MKIISRHLGVLLSCLTGLLVAGGGACASDDRADFDDRAPAFDVDAASRPDGNGCALTRCSSDLRKVLDGCAGTVLEVCSDKTACGDGKCIEPCVAAALAKSSNGCEFYLQPPAARGDKVYVSCYAAFVTNPNPFPIDLTLERESKALDISESIYGFAPESSTPILHRGPIAAGKSVALFVSSATKDNPNGIADCPAGTKPAFLDPSTKDLTSGVATSFHLRSSGPIAAATVYPYGGAPSFIPSSTVLLPVASWGVQHVVVNAWQLVTHENNGYKLGMVPAAQIVAAEDATEITILPNVSILSVPANQFVGSPAGVAKTYRLDRGEFLQIAQPDDLTGSLVQSTKPTSVFGGHRCMLVPADTPSCDTAQQQLPPYAQWGNVLAGVRYRGRQTDSEETPYRLVAAVEGTTLSYDPAPPPQAPMTLRRGEVATFWTSRPFAVSSQDAEHPIYMAAYMTAGQPAGGQGDPEFVNVIPAGQWMQDYAFFADPTYPETSMVVVRERSNGKFSDVRLECATGNIEGFAPIGTQGRFEYARVDLSRDSKPVPLSNQRTCGYGIQRLHSEAPFTVTLWGWGPSASYAVPGGSANRKLVSRPLDVR